jgi:hypothetical protein
MTTLNINSYIDTLNDDYNRSCIQMLMSWYDVGFNATIKPVRSNVIQSASLNSSLSKRFLPYSTSEEFI